MGKRKFQKYNIGDYCRYQEVGEKGIVIFKVKDWDLHEVYVFFDVLINTSKIMQGKGILSRFTTDSRMYKESVHLTGEELNLVRTLYG